MLKPALVTIALAGCVTGWTPASAQAPSGDWSFVAGAATDNRSKDASKSAGGPYGFGLAEWSSTDGAVYGGPKFETIRSSTGSQLELELNAGYRPQIAGFDVDLNLAHKWQVGADPNQDDDAYEFTLDVSRPIGPFEPAIQIQHSPDGTGGVRAWTWVAASLGWYVTDRLEASAGLGRREQDDAPDYTGWSAGVAYALTDAAQFELSWHDTDAADESEQYEGALVAAILIAF